MDSRTSQLSIKGSFGSIQRQMILSFFFSSARETLVTLLQDIYSTVQYSTYLTRTTKHNKLIQFPVCADVGVLFVLDILLHANLRSGDFFGQLHVCKKHIQTRFSLQQFRFWSITQSEMLCYVSVQCYLRQSYGSDFSVGSPYVLILSVYLSYLDQVLLPMAVMPFIYQNKAQKSF